MPQGLHLSTSGRPTVGIVGAGVCGLGIGWRLAAAGLPGRQSSIAASRARAPAGRPPACWPPQAEAEPGEERCSRSTCESQAQWPGFARGADEAASGARRRLPRRGHAGRRARPRRRRSAAGNLRLPARTRVWRSNGCPAAEARRREPFWRPTSAPAVYSPADHQVDNRQAGRGPACRPAWAAGAALHEGAEVAAIDIEAAGPRGLALAGDDAGPRGRRRRRWRRAPGPAALPGLPPMRRAAGAAAEGTDDRGAMDPATPLLRHVAVGARRLPACRGTTAA